MDDAGYQLIKRYPEKGFLPSLGRLLVQALPVIIKVLAVVGTLALILVSGGIFTHHIVYLHPLLAGFPAILKETIAGIAAGLIVFGMTVAAKKMKQILR